MIKTITQTLAAIAFALAPTNPATAGRPLLFANTDLHKYPDNMSFTCVVQENGQRIMNCEVAAFDENEELRGSYYTNDQGIVFLMVQGERTLGTLHFKVVTGDGDDTSTFTIRDINETHQFRYNDILGDPLNPFVFTVGNDDIATSITSPSQGAGGSFYNLAGQRISTPSKGLYIVNGKKTLITPKP